MSNLATSNPGAVKAVNLKVVVRSHSRADDCYYIFDILVIINTIALTIASIITIALTLTLILTVIITITSTVKKTVTITIIYYF